MRALNEKPKTIRLQAISDLFFDYYWVPEMDKWVDELIMDYEDRLLKLKNKIEELRSLQGSANNE